MSSRKILLNYIVLFVSQSIYQNIALKLTNLHLRKDLIRGEVCLRGKTPFKKNKSTEAIFNDYFSQISLEIFKCTMRDGRTLYLSVIKHIQATYQK